MSRESVSKMLSDFLARFLPEDRSSLLREMERDLSAEGFRFLETRFASLPRRLGRELLPRGLAPRSAGVDMGTLRACDVAAAHLLHRQGLGAAFPELSTLYRQGDAEERRMILKSLAFLDPSPTTVRLLEEAHRTNDQVLFEAGLLDADLPARCLDREAYRNVVLKAAFLDISVERLPGWENLVSEQLSSMLLDFMAEREAAGRAVWADSLLVCSRAPCPGVLARIVGDLWHGEDRRRLGAARAARHLADPALRPWILERLPREASPPVRGILSEGPQ